MHMSVVNIDICPPVPMQVEISHWASDMRTHDSGLHVYVGLAVVSRHV